MAWLQEPRSAEGPGQQQSCGWCAVRHGLFYKACLQHVPGLPPSAGLCGGADASAAAHNACRHVPQRLEALCVGSIHADKLGLNALPAAAYVPPADRYAVVPDHHSAACGSVGTVPEMPALKKPRA